jgi:Family of unknown function (DUF6508)
MKLANASGREYYFQRSRANQMANWCSKVTPVRIEIDGVPVEAYANREKSDWIYLRHEETVFCFWAKEPQDFEFLEETLLHVTDPGRHKTPGNETGTAKRKTGSPAFRIGKEGEALTRSDLEAVLIHLPQIREQVELRQREPERVDDVYSPEFTAAVRRVVDAFHQNGFMFPFNYQPWLDEARKLEEDQELVGKSDLETLRKLLIVHWRQDYWDHDHNYWEFISANGHLVALLERLEEIAEGMEYVNDGDNEDTMMSKPSDTPTGAGKPARRPFPVAPSSDEYTRGFEAIRDRLTDQQAALLRTHYHSEGYRASVQDLARKCGIESWRTVNRQYGEVAKLVLTAMGYDKPTSKDSSLWFTGICFGFDSMEMTLRPQVVKALVRSGIVEANANEQHLAEKPQDLAEDVPASRPLKVMKGPTGDVEGFKDLAGTFEESVSTRGVAITVDDQAGPASSGEESDDEWAGTMTLLDIGKIAAWLCPLDTAVAQHLAAGSGSDGGALDNLLQQLVQDLEDRDVFVDKNDINGWGTMAYAWANGMTEPPLDNILALRRLLIHHKMASNGGYGNWQKSVEEYWRELAIQGELQKVLRAFDNIYRNTARKTLVSGWME